MGRSCRAKDVVAGMEELTSLYPAPTFIPSDKGTELIAQVLRDWCEASISTNTAYIAPVSPWENRFAESLNGRFRDEFLCNMTKPTHSHKRRFVAQVSVYPRPLGVAHAKLPKRNRRSRSSIPRDSCQNRSQ